jgi:ribosomal protein S18 acetylase RimI-like enzyme
LSVGDACSGRISALSRGRGVETLHHLRERQSIEADSLPSWSQVFPTPGGEDMDVEVLELRRYDDSDALRVWRLHEEGLRQMDARWGEGPWDDDLRSVGATYLANRGEFLVGVLNCEVVAMGALRRVSEHVGEIKRMRVDVRFQGQGFGQVLLEALEERARELGYGTLRLDTTTTMIPAQRLYESSGYREAARDLYPSGREAIIFEKRLA